MGILSRFFKKNSPAQENAAEVHLSIVEPNELRRPKVWAIGGGKGGVGKTFLTANAGVLLAKAGHRVLSIDADLGAANLHTLFGLEGSRLSLSSFLKGSVADVRNMISPSGIAGLDIISGARDSLDIADAGTSAISRLEDALLELEYDYVLLDIAPGTSSNMLEFFLMSDSGLLVTTPEPTSIENTYRFLKCLFLKRIKHLINSGDSAELKEKLRKAIDRNPRISTVADIVASIRQVDPERGVMLKEIMGRTCVNLVINKVRVPQDSAVGPQMEKACRGYFGINISHLGDICVDSTVEDSVRLKKPLAVHYPQSGSTLAISGFCTKLLDFEQKRQAGMIGA